MKKLNVNLKYFIILLLAIILLASFTCLMTFLANDYQQIGKVYNDNNKTSIINQFYSICVLFFMGLIVLFPLRKKIGTTQTLLLSYVIGLLAFEFISVLLLLFHVYYSLLSVLSVYLLIVILYYIFIFKKDKDALKLKQYDLTKIIFWSFLTLALGYTFSRTPISIISFDSVQYRLLGEVYAKEHYFVDYVYYQLSGHALIPTLLNSIAYMFNFSYSYAIQNMFVISSISLFGYLLYSETRIKGFAKNKSFIMASIGTLVLATSFFLLFLGVCLVPNIFAGFFMLFLMYYVCKYIRQRNKIDLVLSFVFMVAFSFTRVEGPLIAVFIMAYFAHKNIDTKSLLKYTGGLLSVVLLWYISFFVHVGINYEGDFLTLNKCIMIVGLQSIVLVYIFLKDRYFKKHNDRLFMLYILAVIIFAIGINMLDITKFMVNLKTLYLNMFAEGLWHLAWFGVIIFSIIAMIITKKKDTFLEGMIPTYLLLMLAIFAFRETTLHINWSDSGNRLLMHIYPLIVFTVSDNIISYFIADKNREL